MLTISKATAEDFSFIQEIAYQTWPHTYGKILSNLQLDYMLDLFYSNETLCENLNKKGHCFILVKEDETYLGFASYEHNYKGGNKTHLHKIYILPEAQGKKIGSMLLNKVEDFAKEDNSVAVSLNVNKYNKAQHFYKKMGYEIISEEVIDIGHNFVMDDYVMEKKW